MSERQILIQWLSQVARRLRLIQGIQLLSTVTFWLLVIALVHQILRAAIPQPLVLSALMPLLVLGAVTVLVWAAIGFWKRPSLIDAALATDHRAQLRDQLTSAYWFASGGASGQAADVMVDSNGDPTASEGPVVQVLITRAAHTAQGLQLPAVFPIGMSHTAWGSLLVAVLVGGMTWWSPVWTEAERDAGDGAAARAQAGRAVRAKVPGKETQSASRESDATQADGDRQNIASHSSSRQSGTGSDPFDPTASDGAAQERPPQESLVGAAVNQGTDGAVDSGRGRSQNTAGEPPSEWLDSVIARLKEMVNDGSAPTVGDTAKAEGEGRGEVRVGSGDNGANRDMGGRNERTEMRNADNSGGSDLRMNAVGGTGPRNAVAGQGNGEEQSGRGNSGGGALGRRIGVSRAGAGEAGDAPKGDPSGNGPSLDVLGGKTQRLAMQLKRVPSPAKSQGDKPEPEGGTPEEFFSATRAQAARVQAQAPEASGAARTTRTQTQGTEQTPLAYRAVVKDYFLNQHRKED